MNVRFTLEQVLRRGVAEGVAASNDERTWGIEHATRRLVASLECSAFGLDQAVLLRQCLRFLPERLPIVIDRLPTERARLLERVGVRQRIDGVIEAHPYRPTWLGEDPCPEVDTPADCTVVADAPFQGEPWLLQRLNKKNWKSHAQREIVWRALRAPHNSTQLIGLPTGAGKSLVYQCCAAFESGLTLVVVPTVALGLDQLSAVRSLPFAADSNPRLYSSREDAEQVLQAVTEKSCRLLITSPEACVSGRLRPVLRRLAEDGWLRRVVVDEAHIVESWGASFRIEFQLLGSVVRSWRTVAPHGLRVVLLSATFTQDTPLTLRSLFADEGTHWEQCVIQRLRPEIQYYCPRGVVSRDMQEHAVTEALHMLPRPMILYVTERMQAERWHDRIQELGFSRSACFHGDTPASKRDEIMAGWRRDALDLVVATSAFGMGVDKPDVRAVVHACYPENIDRFYQEVGRGGRDGAITVSLVIPTARDVRVGRAMGPILLTDEEKIEGRWRALWFSRSQTDSGDFFRILLETQPNYRLGARSYGENVRWNKRLLMMMQRAGLIRVEGLEWMSREEAAEPVETAVIRPLRSTFDLERNLATLLEASRAVELEVINKSRHLLDRLLNHAEAPCRLLRQHYGPLTVRACGSCVLCRAGGEDPRRVGELRFDDEDRSTRPLVDVVDAPDLRHASGRARAALALRNLLRFGVVRRFVASRGNELEMRELVTRADEGVGAIYRVDDAVASLPSSVSEDEVCLVLHKGSVDLSARPFNFFGRRVGHWVFGGGIEQPPGRWPFLQEFGARVFAGGEAMETWVRTVAAEARDKNVHG